MYRKSLIKVIAKKWSKRAAQLLTKFQKRFIWVKNKFGTSTAFRMCLHWREATRSDEKQPKFDVIDNCERFQPVVNFASGCSTSLGQNCF